jgi:hypothetical protein
VRRKKWGQSEPTPISRSKALVVLFGFRLKLVQHCFRDHVLQFAVAAQTTREGAQDAIQVQTREQ